MEPSITTTATTLTAGFNHVAILTRDLDRWVEFWTEVFGTTFTEFPDERGRHGFLSLAADSSSVLHAFEIPPDVSGGDFPDGGMFRRGRLDHIAIGAADEASLLVIRDRLVARDVSDGSIRLFGGRTLSVHAVDPEGVDFEVCCSRTGDAIPDSEVQIAR